MNKIFIIFLCLVLTSCLTENDLTSISDKVSNVSDKVVSLVNSDKAKKNLNKDKLCVIFYRRTITNQISISVCIIYSGNWRPIFVI